MKWNCTREFVYCNLSERRFVLSKEVKQKEVVEYRMERQWDQKWEWEINCFVAVERRAIVVTTCASCCGTPRHEYRPGYPDQDVSFSSLLLPFHSMALQPWALASSFEVS
jgi:Fe-S oxidoreductase